MRKVYKNFNQDAQYVRTVRYKHKFHQTTTWLIKIHGASKTNSYKCTAVSDKQTCLKYSCFNCPKSPCQAVTECRVDCSRLVIQQQRNFCHPIKYWCRRSHWQNKDDITQGRWWRWAGITQLGTAGFDIAETWIPGSRCNPRPVATGRVSCVCDWFRDATGLDFGDRSWISNVAQDGLWLWLHLTEHNWQNTPF